MLNEYQALAGGVLLAGLGGEFFLRGVVGLAQKLRVSTGVVATTIAAFATSSPELSVAISSASAGEPEISLGDALGSNIVNVALILGLALLIAPVSCPRRGLSRDLGTALLTPAAVGALALDGILSRLDGLLLIILFGLWLAATIRESRAQRKSTPPPQGECAIFPALVAGAGGLACLFAGARLVVIGAHSIALQFGIAEFVIGATIVAVGTSVPELATAVMSQIRGHKEIGLGTVLGSNIFNGLFIVGTAAVIHPIPTGGHQFGIALVVGAVTVAMILPPRSRLIGRVRGILLLAAYVTYVIEVLRR